MNILLLVSADCKPCRNAERLWSAVCAELGLALRVVDLEEAEGRDLVGRLGLNSLPVLLIDGRVTSVGVPDTSAAKALLQAQTPVA